jgi:hypothetical protein
MYIGDLDASADLLKRAARLDPLFPKPFMRLLVRALYLRGELDEATRLIRCLDDADPPALAVAAAVGILRGEDVAPIAARVPKGGKGWTPASNARLFRDVERRARWLSGFERAGLA